MVKWDNGQVGDKNTYDLFDFIRFHSLQAFLKKWTSVMTANYKAIKGDVNFIEETYSLLWAILFMRSCYMALPGGLWDKLQYETTSMSLPQKNQQTADPYL